MKSLTNNEQLLSYVNWGRLCNRLLSKLPLNEILNLSNYKDYFTAICSDDYFWYLVASYHIPEVILTSGTTWFQLIKILASENVNEGLILSVQTGNITLMKYFLDKEADNWLFAMEEASHRGYKDLIEYLAYRSTITFTPTNWNEGILMAAKGGHKDLIEYFISKGADDLDHAMWGAAEGGHKDLIDYLINRDQQIQVTYNWNWGLNGAAIGGYRDLIEFFIYKGADDWNRGLDGAVIGGHKDLVEFFIYKGADDWNRGMEMAAIGGHKDLVNFLLLKEQRIGIQEWMGQP